jgi:hypothetical protein
MLRGTKVAQIIAMPGEFAVHPGPEVGDEIAVPAAASDLIIPKESLEPLHHAFFHSAPKSMARGERWWMRRGSGVPDSTFGNEKFGGRRCGLGRTWLVVKVQPHFRYTQFVAVLLRGLRLRRFGRFGRFDGMGPITAGEKVRVSHCG